MYTFSSKIRPTVLVCITEFESHSSSSGSMIQVDIRSCGACWCIGRDDAFDRRVVGSNPALYSRHEGTLGKPFTDSTVAFSASACKLRHSVNCCGRERF